MIRQYKYQGAGLIQESLPYSHYIASDNQGLEYTPTSPAVMDGESIGEAYHTHYPLEGRDILWGKVSYNWTRGTNIEPAVFENIISIYGVTEGHDEELIAEDIVTTCSSPASAPLTETRTFDLMSSACQPPFTQSTPNTTGGRVRVDLPFRWKYYEDATLTTLYTYTDNFNDNSINTSYWTVSTPTGTVAETGGAMRVSIGTGVTSGTFTTAPMVYTPLPDGDWVVTARCTETSMNGEVQTGIMALSDRSNLVYIEAWRHGDGTYYIDGGKVVGGSGTKGSTVTVANPQYYFRISKTGNSYVMEYSLNGQSWTNLYTENSFTTTPVNVGFFTDHWGGVPQPADIDWENFSLSTQTGNATYNLTSTPITPTDEDMSIYFATPTGFIEKSYTQLTINEHGNYDYQSPPTLTKTNDALRLGYDGLDKYDAIRIHVKTTANNDYNVKFNWWEYTYEV